MKKCKYCKIEYSDLWYRCIKCHGKLNFERKKVSLFRKQPAQDFSNPAYLLEQLIEQANTLIVFSTPEGEALMCNSGVEYFTGYKRDEIFSQNWTDLLFKEQEARKEMFKAVMKASLISVRSKTYEGAVVKKDGSQCMLSWRLAAIKDNKNKKLGVLCVAHDVTDRKVTEDDIDIHGHKFRDILSSIREYVLMTTNLEGKITYYGLGGKDIFGWSADEVYLEDISLIYPDDDKSGQIKKISDQMQRTGKFEREIKLVRRGGVKFSAILTINPLLNRESQTIGYTYMAKDITGKKKVEEQILQSEKMAAVGRLASGVAHEINNPLFVILGRLDLVEGMKMPENLQKTFNTVKAQAQRMRNIVDRLLSYSRVKQLDLKPLDAKELLQSIPPLLNYYSEFKKSTWKEEFQKSIPMIKGDFSHLQEVLVNLGLNACQAMPDGGEIKVATKYTEGADVVELLISDAGQGMNDEQLQKLFDPFFTTKEKGTGLGLAIVRNIVDMHKGKISVESTLGRGTTFRIRLPIEREN